MRIATWNINGIRARLDFLRGWLRERRPDLVGLQELKVEDARFPHAEIEAEGYRALVHGQRGWNGVAVLSLKPATLIRRGLPGTEPQGARLIEAQLGALRFASVYVPNGKDLGSQDFPRKLAWLDALAAWLGKTLTPGTDLVLGGDFNLCPGALDSYDEERLKGSIFHTDEERRRFTALLDAGLVDAFRDRYPASRTFSWWDYRGGAFHRGLGLRIDLLLLTPGLMGRVRGVEVDREYRKRKGDLTPSDHAPVIAELEP